MPQLAEFADGKIIVSCECGLNRRYDGQRMLSRAGDIPMPDLLARIVRAEGCAALTKSGVYARCKARYDLQAMRESIKKDRQP